MEGGGEHGYLHLTFFNGLYIICISFLIKHTSFFFKMSSEV